MHSDWVKNCHVTCASFVTGVKGGDLFMINVGKLIPAALMRDNGSISSLFIASIHPDILQIEKCLKGVVALFFTIRELNIMASLITTTSPFKAILLHFRIHKN